MCTFDGLFDFNHSDSHQSVVYLLFSFVSFCLPSTRKGEKDFGHRTTQVLFCPTAKMLHCNSCKSLLVKRKRCTWYLIMSFTLKLVSFLLASKFEKVQARIIAHHSGGVEKIVCKLSHAFPAWIANELYTHALWISIIMWRLVLFCFIWRWLLSDEFVRFFSLLAAATHDWRAKW